MFPADLPVLVNPTGASDLDDPAVLHSAQHASVNDLIEAVAAKLGVDGSVVATTIDYLVKAAVDPGHSHSAYVAKALLDANTILAADVDNTPGAVPVAASTVVGRKAAGGIQAYSMADLRSLLGAGTADATTFLRGDGTWAAVSGSVASDAIFDAKGDLPVGTGADAASRLPVGSNGQVLTADSTQATGVKWAAAGGSAITFKQTIYAGASDLSTSSTSFVDIDSTNLPALSLTLAVGDVVLCELTAMFKMAASGNGQLFDWLVDRPVSADTNLRGSKAAVGMHEYSASSLDGNTDTVRGTFVCTEAGVHTFKPQWRVTGSTGYIQLAGTFNAPVVHRVMNLGPAA